MRTAGFNPDDYPDMLLVKQAAEMAQIPVNTVYKWCEQGTGGFRRVTRPGVQMIPKGFVLAMLDRLRVEGGTRSALTLLQVNDAMAVIADLVGESVEAVEAELHWLEDYRYIGIRPLEGKDLRDYCASGELPLPLEAHLVISVEEPEGRSLALALLGLLIGRPYRRCWHCSAKLYRIRGDAPIDTQEAAREVEHAKPYRIRRERYKCRTCGGEFPVIELMEPTG